ncbi:MAG: hypothetical protein ACT4QF_11760 [Sporichthyaceae bacterium]
MRAIRATGASAALVGLISAAFLALLGWDDEYYRAADGHLSGPWEAWQVALFVLALVAIVVQFQVLGTRLAALAFAPITVTAWWVWWAVRTDDGQGLWPIGAAMVYVGSAVGVFVTDSLIELLPSGRRQAAEEA